MDVDNSGLALPENILSSKSIFSFLEAGAKDFSPLQTKHFSPAEHFSPAWAKNLSPLLVKTN
jgi:hypothetical protein